MSGQRPLSRLAQSVLTGLRVDGPIPRYTVNPGIVARLLLEPDVELFFPECGSRAHTQHLRIKPAPALLRLRLTRAQGLELLDLDLGRFLERPAATLAYDVTAAELRELLALLNCRSRPRAVRNLRRKIVNVLIEAGETTL